MGVADQEEIEVTAVDADRHAQRDPFSQHADLAHLAQGPAHAHGGLARPHLVVVAGEEDQQRIPAELEQATAVRVGDGQEVHETGADGLAELFGAHLAVRGQALGELGEPRDVDEDHRPRDLAVQCLGGVGDPVDDQARQVGREGMGIVDARKGTHTRRRRCHAFDA